jgi:hypothetical protein
MKLISMKTNNKVVIHMDTMINMKVKMNVKFNMNENMMNIKCKR